MRNILLSCLLLLLLVGCAEPSRDDDKLDGVTYSNPFLDDRYRVIVHTAYSPGVAPSPGSIASLATLIEEVGSREVQTPEPVQIAPTPGRHGEEVQAIADQAFGPLVWDEINRTLHLRVLYLNGNMEGHDAVGFAMHWQVGLIVILPEQMPNTYLWLLYTDLPMEDRFLAERAILAHEYGHLLGLVNCGLPMTVARHDDDSPCHSTQDDSVMRILHASQDPTEWAQRDERGPVWKFDIADWQDIRAYQAELAAGL